MLTKYEYQMYKYDIKYECQVPTWYTYLYQVSLPSTSTNKSYDFWLWFVIVIFSVLDSWSWSNLKSQILPVTGNRGIIDKLK